MANYSLNFTGAQINDKLAQVDNKLNNSMPTILKQNSSGEGGEIILQHSLGSVDGHIDLLDDGGAARIRIHNGSTEITTVRLSQPTTITQRIFGQSWINCTHNASFTSIPNVWTSGTAYSHLSCRTHGGAWCICTLDDSGSDENRQALWFCYGTDTNFNNNNNTVKHFRVTSSCVFKGATYNDYAETRLSSVTKPGSCLYEVGDGTMALSTERLMRGCRILSDTCGFVLGKHDEGNVPVAVSGRVLVYFNEGRDIAAKHIGWPVCSGPNGTVSLMTEEEEQKYPSRIIGTISEIPTYEVWGDNDAKVDGRIWIYIK